MRGEHEQRLVPRLQHALPVEQLRAKLGDDEDGGGGEDVVDAVPPRGEEADGAVVLLVGREGGDEGLGGGDAEEGALAEDAVAEGVVGWGRGVEAEAEEDGAVEEDARLEEAGGVSVDTSLGDSRRGEEALTEYGESPPAGC